MKYLSLTEEISDTQILILEYFVSNPKKSYRTDIVAYLAYGKGWGSKIKTPVEKEFIMFTGKSITFADIDFLVQDMVSEGLLITKEGRTMITRHDEYHISVIGKSFINFIKEYGNEL